MNKQINEFEKDKTIMLSNGDIKTFYKNHCKCCRYSARKDYLENYFHSHKNEINEKKNSQVCKKVETKDTYVYIRERANRLLLQKEYYEKNKK